MSDQTGFEEHFNALMRSRSSAVTFDMFESGSIEHDGNRLHLDIMTGKPGAATIVFVPGTAAYGLVYGDFLAGLAEQGLNVVSFDPRGHGRSEGVRGSYTIEEIVSDTRAVTAYARKRFGGAMFLSGSSQGGIVAFYTAATDEALAGVICHNAADLADPDNLERMGSPKSARTLKGIVGGLARIVPNFPINIARYFNMLSKGEQKAKDRMAKDPYLLKVIRLKALASLGSAKMERPVEEIKTPVMLLHAGNDTIFPQSLSEHLHGRLTGEKNLQIYPGLGHFLFSEHIQEVMPDIVEWVGERARSVEQVA